MVVQKSSGLGESRSCLRGTQQMSSDSKLDGREALLQALRQVHTGLVRLTAAHSRQIISLIAARGREGGEGREDREDPVHTERGTVRSGLSNEQHVRELAWTKIVELIAARAPETSDRYAELRSRSRTPSASELIARICTDIEHHEQSIGSRVRKRRERSGAKFSEALERFVGDLLRARAGTNTTGRIFRSVGKSSFGDAPVKYDMFVRLLEALKALGLVGHRKGQTRYHETGFEPGHKVTISGRAARFWATPKLVKLAEELGIHSGNVGDHFAPEPPTNPLVLKDYATGRGRYRESGPVIKDYERTPETEGLERDIKELNEFLAGFELTGGRHEGYIRIFNNRSWKKGGRLYSQCQDSYQLIPEHKRLEMKINGEAVAEIDIKASFLTIYHAMVGEPLDGLSDPYARVGIARDIAKQWCITSFGNSAPKTKWPPKTVKEYRENTGQDLRKVAKASAVSKLMLEAFPALKKLEECSDIWADLQFIESEAIIGTMLILMRTHRAPSFSTHDGIIVPRSKADLAKTILAKEYRRKVGVDPMLRVEPENLYGGALDL
jgi:hypothetical protein